MPEERFLCVHVPEFAAQARLRHRPALRTQGIAILDGTPPLQTVCSATHQARELGVERGMTRAQLDSFPGIEALTRSEKEERSTGEALRTTLWRFSPRVQVLTGRDAAYRLVADVAGTESIFGSPHRLARSVDVEIRRLGLVAQCAVSANFYTAVHVAAFKTVPQIVAKGKERMALADLPLHALDMLLGEQREIFAAWGLRTLGEIAALPEAQLVARLGEVGRRAWRMARGEHGHVMQPEEEQFALEERACFDSPVEMLDSLLFVLGPMLEQLIARASSRALALASVTIQLQLTKYTGENDTEANECGTYTRTIKPALPLTDSRVLLKLLHLELQSHPPGAPVVSVGLLAEPGDRARSQLGLFSPLPETSRLDITLARLSALVGEGRVGRPKLLDTHRPDSFTIECFAAPVMPARAPIARRSDPCLAQRPASGLQGSWALRRLRPPVLVRIHVSQDKPAWFFWNGARYEITSAFGPWRRSGSWWSTAVWSCEEWDVIAAAIDGATLTCRLSRDLLRRHWVLEGLYD